VTGNIKQPCNHLPVAYRLRRSVAATVTHLRDFEGPPARDAQVLPFKSVNYTAACMPLLLDEGFTEEDSIMNDHEMLDIIGSVQEREGELCSFHYSELLSDVFLVRTCLSTSCVATKGSFSSNTEKDRPASAVRCCWRTYVILMHASRF
jgi:hypothetical protein